MGKKFMIVKPKPCCGKTGGVGRVFETSGRKANASLRCVYCGDAHLSPSAILYSEGGHPYSIDESRIVWLPDEDEFKNETYDEELTV